jgi:hypothetical protein
MSHPVLNEDWTDYDNRKIRDRRDSSRFSCDEAWEVDYLVSKLKKHFPFKSDTSIRSSISACCNTIKAPRQRDEFVECVAALLSR